jgi:hypothetical protein
MYLVVAMQDRRTKVKRMFGDGSMESTLGSWPWRLGEVSLKLAELGWRGRVWVMNVKPRIKVGGQEKWRYVCKF